MPASRNALHSDPLLKECALFDIQRTSRVVASLYNAHLRRAGITVAQFSLLRSIAVLQPVGIGRLAEGLAMERTSVTRLIEPLIDRGFARTSAGEDRRVRNVELTAKGEAAIRAAAKHWRSAQRELFETLGRKQWLAMRTALRTTVRRVKERVESA
jgi:DNA-binding MarR family transcriptional regulator